MRSVLRNISLLALGDVACKFLGLLAISYMARVLGPEAFGQINIGLAVLGYLTLTASPGIHLYGTRCVAAGKDETSEVVVPVTRLRLSLAALLVIGVLSAVAIAGQGSAEERVILLFSFSLVPLALSMEWYHQGKERMALITGSRLILSGVYLLALLLLVRERGDVVGVPIAFLIGNAAGSALLLIAWIRSTGTARSILRGAGTRWRDLLRASIPMGIGSTLAQMVYHLPPILIGLTLGPTAVGHFSAAMRVVIALLVADRAMSLVFFPIVVRAWNRDPGMLSSVSDRFLRMIVALALPACLAVSAWAPQVISTIYGPEFRHAESLLRVLIWFFFLTSLNTVFLFGLMGVGQEKRYARIMALGTAAQVGLMLILASPLGLLGISIGFVGGELLITILGFIEYGKVARIALSGTVYKPAIAGLAMALLLYFHPLGGRPAELIAAGAVYLGTLIAVGGISRDDLLVWVEES